LFTHLSPKYEALRNSKNGWSIQEAGMAELDDDVGLVMSKLKDMGVDDNTIVFTTDNGTELFTWPDGGTTPFAQSKGTVMEGGFRVPAILRWPGHVPADSVQNGIFSGLDWLPTFVAAPRASPTAAISSLARSPRRSSTATGRSSTRRSTRRAHRARSGAAFAIRSSSRVPILRKFVFPAKAGIQLRIR
jgi:arylsulfatase A-like enzyme